MGILQKIGIVWQNIPFVQRVTLMAVSIGVVVMGALLAHWASRPEMRMLYKDLSPDDAAVIADKIAEQNIPYELRHGGTSIYVPEKQVYELRLTMAKEGLPSSSNSGYGIFDKEKIGVSPFVQNINFRRALQDELAMSIAMIQGVSSARVHIVDSKRNVFSGEKDSARASVVLQLEPGFRVGNLNVAAITHLVAGSIEGMKPQTVTVVDQNGNLLSGENSGNISSAGAATVADYKQRVENNLETKVQDLLGRVLGPGRSSVSVSATVDMTHITQVNEKYDPTAKVATKEEIKSNSEVETPGGEEDGGGNTKKDETIVTEYKVGRTVEEKVELPGEILSVKVAAVVDLSISDPNDPEAGGKIMQLADVEQLIRDALGLNDGDSLTVVDARFYKPAAPIEEVEEKKLNLAGIVKQASMGIMAICALLALKILGGGKKKAETAAVAALQQQGAPEGGEAGAAQQMLAASNEPTFIRNQLTEAMQSNPAQVKELFSSWVQEPGG